MTPFFKFELTPFPTSIFRYETHTKPCLKKHLTTDVPKSQPQTDTVFVLDGGIILHRVKLARVTNNVIVV